MLSASSDAVLKGLITTPPALQVHSKSNKVAEYFIVCGLDKEDPSVISKGPSYANQSFLNEVELCQHDKAERLIQKGYAPIMETVEGHTAEFVSGGLFSSTKSYLYKFHDEGGGMVTPSGWKDITETITDIKVINVDEGEKVPPRYYPIASLGSRSSMTKMSGLLVIARKGPADNIYVDVYHETPAIIDIALVNNPLKLPSNNWEVIRRDLRGGNAFSKPMYLCFLRSTPNGLCDIKYEPKVLDRFPRGNSDSMPLPESTAMFAMPTGITLIDQGKHEPLPTWYAFVLTESDGSKIYGVSLVFYERLDAKTITNIEMKCSFSPISLANVKSGSRNSVSMDWINRPRFASKCIAILSHWPFFTGLKDFCTQVYRLSLSEQDIPLERFISQFILNVHVPAPGDKVLVDWTTSINSAINFAMPSHSWLPVVDISLKPLFSTLSIRTVLGLFSLFLYEKKILLHSKHLSLLTLVAESMRFLMFPLDWITVYIPVAPAQLMEIVQAPMSFVLGVHSSTINMEEVPEDVHIIDIDNDSIVSEEPIPALPAQLIDMLELRLDALLAKAGVDNSGKETLSDVDFAFNFSLPSSDNDEELNTYEIRLTFIRFMVVLLTDYRDYLIPPTSASVGKGDIKSLFDTDKFLQHRSVSYRDSMAYRMLISTQMFADFIWRRAFASTDYSSIMFFESCIDEYMRVRSTNAEDFTSMFDWPFPNKRRRGSVTIPKIKHIRRPLRVGLEEKSKFHYEQWPVLKDSLFSDEESFMGGLAPLLHSPGGTLSPPVLPSPHASASLSSKERRKSFKDMIAIRTEQERRESIAVDAINDDPALWTDFLLRHVIGSWLLCSPTFVSHGSNRSKAIDIVHNLVSVCRSKHLVLNQNSYRCAMIACERAGRLDFTSEIFNTMQHNGIHLNVLTFGQYTKTFSANAGSVLGKIGLRDQAMKKWRAIKLYILCLASFTRNWRSKKRESMHRGDHGSTSPTQLLSDRDFNDIVKERSSVRPRGKTTDSMLSSMKLNQKSSPNVFFAGGDTSSKPPRSGAALRGPEATHSSVDLKSPPVTKNEPIKIGGGPLKRLGSLENSYSGKNILGKKLAEAEEGAVPTYKSHKVKYSLHDFPYETLCVTGLSQVTREKAPRRRESLGKKDDDGGAGIVGGGSIHPHHSLKEGSDRFDAVVAMWSKTPCPDCNFAPFDEQMMAMWTEVDNEVSITCHICSTLFTPTLQYRVFDEKGFEPQSHFCGTITGTDDMSGAVPYLCPQLLRHQLEWLLQTEGENSLYRSKLRKSNAPLYWNMVWYCTRLGFPLPFPDARYSDLPIRKEKVLLGFDNTMLRTKIVAAFKQLSAPSNTHQRTGSTMSESSMADNHMNIMKGIEIQDKEKRLKRMSILQVAEETAHHASQRIKRGSSIRGSISLGGASGVGLSADVEAGGTLSPTTVSRRASTRTSIHHSNLSSSSIRSLGSAGFGDKERSLGSPRSTKHLSWNNGPVVNPTSSVVTEEESDNLSGESARRPSSIHVTHSKEGRDSLLSLGNRSRIESNELEDLDEAEEGEEEDEVRKRAERLAFLETEMLRVKQELAKLTERKTVAVSPPLTAPIPVKGGADDNVKEFGLRLRDALKARSMQFAVMLFLAARSRNTAPMYSHPMFRELMHIELEERLFDNGDPPKEKGAFHLVTPVSTTFQIMYESAISNLPKEYDSLLRREDEAPSAKALAIREKFGFVW